MVLYLLGFLNTNVAQKFVDNVGGETITYEVGEVSKIPCKLEKSKKSMIENFVSENIDFSIVDWDSFETSWDFKKSPLI